MFASACPVQINVAIERLSDILQGCLEEMGLKMKSGNRSLDRTGPGEAVKKQIEVQEADIWITCERRPGGTSGQERYLDSLISSQAVIK